MTRIFLTLALFSVGLLATTLILGLSIGDLHDVEDTESLRWFRVHFLFGLAAALSVVFVNSIAVTYFIGTSRWCKEVVQTYGLDVQLARQSYELKRHTFFWAVIGMLTVVGVIALGAASDPATGRPTAPDWAIYHLAGALAGVAVVVFTYTVAWNNIASNHQVIRNILEQVRDIRTERGLDVDQPVAT